MSTQLDYIEVDIIMILLLLVDHYNDLGIYDIHDSLLCLLQSHIQRHNRPHHI